MEGYVAFRVLGQGVQALGLRMQASPQDLQVRPYSL